MNCRDKLMRRNAICINCREEYGISMLHYHCKLDESLDEYDPCYKSDWNRCPLNIKDKSKENIFFRFLRFLA